MHAEHHAQIAAVAPLDYLASLEFFGIKLGLDRIHALLEAAGNPQLRRPVLHIAGTNGKGSILAILDAILRAAGYSTGRFTSPHLLDVSERFLVNAVPIEEEALCEGIVFFRDIAACFDAPPTYFELCTAIALRHFARRNVDAMLIETGMGGRLDSTNAVRPSATAIATIDFDHTRYLGETLEAIAGEKAGIIKAGVPVVIGETKPAPLRVLEDAARSRHAPALILGRDFDAVCTGSVWRQQLSYRGPVWHLDGAPLRLAGRFQAGNAAVALTLAGILEPMFPRLDERAVRDGLAHAVWPCRLECVLDEPTVILDAAHNAAGAQRLAETLEGEYVLVLAVSGDKDAGAMVAALAPRAAPLIFTTFANARARTVESLCALAGGFAHRTAPDMGAAVEEGLRFAAKGTPLVIAGSIFAVAEARQVLCERYGARPLAF